MTDAERNAARASTIHRPALRYHPLSGVTTPKKGPWYKRGTNERLRAMKSVAMRYRMERLAIK